MTMKIYYRTDFTYDVRILNKKYRFYEFITFFGSSTIRSQVHIRGNKRVGSLKVLWSRSSYLNNSLTTREFVSYDLEQDYFKMDEEKIKYWIMAKADPDTRAELLRIEYD